MPDTCSPAVPCDVLAGAPIVPRAAAALSRHVGCGLQCDVPGTDTQWLVLPPIAGGPPGHWWLLDTTAGPVYLEDGARFIAGLCGIDGGVEAWPPWLVAAAAGRLAGTPLAGLRAVRRADPPADLIPLAWRLCAPGHTFACQAAASAATWLALLAGPALAPLRMPWNDWRRLVLDHPVLLATHRLPLALHTTLAGGDVVLPDRALFDAAGAGRITLAGRHWRVAFVHPCHLQLLTEETTMQTEPLDDAIPDQDTPAATGAVTVTLRFELGRLPLTLDQLRALGPGSVLALQDGAPRRIAIACNGATVGSGEVVDVEGQLGVRITSWSGAC